MKKIYVNACKGVAMASLFFMLNACHKAGDIFHHGGGAGTPTCAVKSITTFPNATDTLFYQFTYNANGNPVRITSNKAAEGLYNLKFEYNAQHRLNYYFAEATPGLPYDFHYLHRYTYNNKGQIVIDSNYMVGNFAAINNGTLQPIQIVHFSYDSYGRMIQAREITYPGTPAELEHINTYSYDGNGNLANGASYDNKTNWAQTHPIWLFLRRDYSVNNSFTAVNYNNKKLPTRLNETISFANTFVGQVLYGNTVVEYECR